jgi:hypothetical protein
MAYATGTLTDANPAAALITLIEAQMTAQGGTWVFVEEVVISTNTYRVWRNKGSGVANPNSFGTDFYIALRRQTAAGSTDVSVLAFEVWDATNKKAIRPVAGSANSQAINANFSFGDETNGFTLANVAAYVGIRPLVTTGFDYIIQVSKNQIAIGAKVSTNDSACYAGLFESLLPSAHPFPLCLVGGGTSSNGTLATTCGVSRHPTVTTTGTNNFQHTLANLITPAGDATSNIDKLHASAVGSRVLVSPSGVVGSYGQFHGLLYNVMSLNQGTTAWRTGDTIPVSGENWVKAYLLGSTTYWLDTVVV